MRPPLTFFSCTFNHKKVSLALREKFALSKDKIETLYTALKKHPFFVECLILNTCNRVEFYCISSSHYYKDAFLEILGSIYSQNINIFLDYIFFYDGKEALEHIFKVCAGIDSQILGETEIFGQVKLAYQEAIQLKTIGPVLHKVIQKAFQTTKYIRTHTGITKGNASTGRLVINLARRIFENLQDIPIIVIGAGQISQQVTGVLHSHGANNITLLNRTLENAQIVANKYNFNYDILSNLEMHLLKSGIVIGSAASDILLIQKELLLKVLKKRKAKPLLLIDLAIPRNFCCTCAKIPNVYLYNLDDLSKITNDNLTQREKEAQRSLDIILSKTKHIWPKIESLFEKVGSSV